MLEVPNIAELDEIIQRVNKRMAEVYKDMNFQGEPPKPSTALTRMIIEEYIEQITDENGEPRNRDV